jgi:hypothetical protein
VLPSYVDDVLEYIALANFPATGEVGKIYVDRTTGKIWRWSGSTYIEISPSPGSTDSVTEGSTNLYFTDARATAATQSALNAKEATANKNVSGGYAGLDSSGLIPATLLPSYVDDVLEYANLAGFPASGETGKIYVDRATGKIHRWTGTVYVEISPSPGSTDSVTEGSTNLYFTSARASAAAPVQSVAGRSGTVTLTSSDVGLGNVDNTSNATERAATATLSSKTLTNPTVNNYTEGVVAIGTVTTASTISLTNGTVQTATLTASTACVFTMPTAVAGKSFTLMLKQAATTGNGTATFTGVKWASAGTPTVTATAGRMDIFSFFSDGTNWYGTVVQGYTP